MSVAATIRQRLEQALRPTRLEIVDESHQHAEVRLAGPGVRVVAGVQVGFIDDVETGGAEGLLQALPNGCRYRHVLCALP